MISSSAMRIAFCSEVPWRISRTMVSRASALAEVATAGFDPVFGARPLKRAIQAQIENPLAKAILEGRFGAKDVIYVRCVGGVMRFEKT